MRHGTSFSACAVGRTDIGRTLTGCGSGACTDIDSKGSVDADLSPMPSSSGDMFNGRMKADGDCDLGLKAGLQLLRLFPAGTNWGMLNS
ncbi:MAG: hypothetical protein K5Q00_01395 [Gammaproteobacteria bacterium]|nr:hypothetical protein [Gammaproteobacteria bacterium]